MSAIQGFLRSRAGALVLVAALGAIAAVVAVSVGVLRTMSPPRRVERPLDFEAVKVRVQELDFLSADGVPLRGLRLPGAPDAPTVVLCHDLGASKSSLFELGLRLHAAGFDVVSFDFRGHGESGGSRSTLGLDEKRDVIAAVDLAIRDLPGAPRVGVYGVGMGAHAAVLAAGDRPAIRVLVLDGLYPDAGYLAARGALGGIDFARGRLDFVARGVFAVAQGRTDAGERASEVIGDLGGRDLLLIAPAGDTDLALAMRRMYDSIPTTVDADGNLVTMPASHGALTGPQLVRYHERVVSFFESRLPR